LRLKQEPETNPEVLSFNRFAEKFEKSGLELVFDDFKFEPEIEDKEMAA